MWADRYLGRSATDEARSDAEAFGINPALLDAPDAQEGLWADHLPAFQAFLTVCDQWRVVAGMGAPTFLGLDYTAVRAGFDLAGQNVTPALWDDIRLIEAGAVGRLNGHEEV